MTDKNELHSRISQDWADAIWSGDAEINLSLQWMGMVWDINTDGLKKDLMGRLFSLSEQFRAFTKGKPFDPKEQWTAAYTVSGANQTEVNEQLEAMEEDANNEGLKTIVGWHVEQQTELRDGILTPVTVYSIYLK